MITNYRQQCLTTSDINEHLPTLFYYTKQCNSVVECGVRDIVSSNTSHTKLFKNSGECCPFEQTSILACLIY